MLRHLLSSAARTSSRSLFTRKRQPNASAYVSSHRALSDQRESTEGLPFSQKESTTNQKIPSESHVTSLLLVGMGLATVLWMTTDTSHMKGGRGGGFGGGRVGGFVGRSSGGFSSGGPRSAPSATSAASSSVGSAKSSASGSSTTAGPVAAQKSASSGPSDKKSSSAGSSAKSSASGAGAGNTGNTGNTVYVNNSGPNPFFWWWFWHPGHCHHGCGCSHEHHQQRKAAMCRTSEDAAVQSIKGVKLSFTMARPTFPNWLGVGGTDVSLSTAVHVKLPKFKEYDDMKEVCDSLSRVGIEVECTESGVRRGLTEYSLKQLNGGVEKHYKKKCDCIRAATSHSQGSVDMSGQGAADSDRELQLCRTDYHPKLPASADASPFEAASLSSKNPLEGVRVSFYISHANSGEWISGSNAEILAGVHVKLPNFRDTDDFKEMCNGLKRLGIEVECSEEGVRRGLAEYALKQMRDGINWHREKKCRYCMTATPIESIWAD